MALNFKTGNGIYEDRSHSDFETCFKIVPRTPYPLKHPRAGGDLVNSFVLRLTPALHLAHHPKHRLLLALIFGIFDRAYMRDVIMRIHLRHPVLECLGTKFSIT